MCEAGAAAGAGLVIEEGEEAEEVVAAEAEVFDKKDWL